MAKAASKRTGTTGRGTGKASSRRTTGRAGKGELEVGNVRRDSGAAGPLPRAVGKSPRGQAGLQLPGEKAVRPTNRTVPVEPKRAARPEREPMSQAALDRRRQVIGTDERRGRGRG